MAFYRLLLPLLGSLPLSHCAIADEAAPTAEMMPIPFTYMVEFAEGCVSG